jgi:MOSC domain-containing protein YiiM
MGKVLALNISSVRGVDKTSVPEAEIVCGWGLTGDAHGGDWDRQVSIFPIEALSKVPADKWDEVIGGGYTENITITDVPLEDLSVGRTVKIGGMAQIRIVHIGKEKYKENGRPYIVSREGRFGVVVCGGTVKVGDPVSVGDR